MPRKKLTLALISNDSSRKATFKKRKRGIIKKVKELSTLCGINACGIIYSPYDSTPEVCPSNADVQRVVSDFRALPEMTQRKQMVDQEAFLGQRLAKASEKLKRMKKDSRELEMTEVMFQCLAGKMGFFNLNIIDLNDLGYLIEQNIRNLNHRIHILESSGMEIGESSNALGAVAPTEGIEMVAAVTPTTAPATMVHEVGPSSYASSAAFINRIQHHHHPYHHQQLYRPTAPHEVGPSSYASSAAFINRIQHHHHPYHHQQLYRPTAPHVGLYEQPWNLHHNQSQQQWFYNPEQMSYTAEQMGFPFMDVNHHHHHHNQPQQNQIPGDTSTDPAAVSSSSIVPVTSPNLTDNI